MKRILTVAVLACALGGGAVLRADEADALKNLDEAKKFVEKQEYKDAETSLKLAEAELDGVAAAKKAAITAQIATVRTAMAAAQGSEGKERLVKELDFALKTMKESIGFKDSMDRQVKEMEETLNKDETKALLTPEQIAAYRKKAATFQKVSDAQAAEKAVAELKPAVDSLEKRMAEILEDLKGDSPAAQQNAADRWERDAQGIAESIKRLPADDATVKAQAARFAKLNDSVMALVVKNRAAEEFGTLSRGWEIYKDEWDGWEKETEGPTLARLVSEQSEKLSLMNAPKTAALLSRAESWMEERAKDENFKAMLADPKIKGLYDKVSGDQAKAWAKLAKFADVVLSEAEKTKLNQDSRHRLERFVDADLRLSMSGYPKLAELQARGKKLVDNFDAATLGADAAKEKLYNSMVESAKAQWPEIAAKLKAQDGFDPANAAALKGKVVRFKAANRMGWDFKPGDFGFATTINGNPVAGRYDPVVKAAIADMTRRTGKDLPEETSYDVIAVVEGPGKLVKFEDREGTITGDGGSVKVSGRANVTVDAPVLRIIGLHVGPIGVGVGAGSSAPKEEGMAPTGDGGGGNASAGGSGGSLGSSGGSVSRGAGFFGRLFALVIGLTAAGAALLKAQFAPLASAPQLGAVRANLAGDRIAYLGIACAAFGLLWFFRAPLLSLAIIAAGGFAAIDLLSARGVIKGELAAKIRPLGVPIGLGCAALQILFLITGGRLWLI